MAIDKWDERFLNLAEHVAGWSKDPSTQVGAVIANPSNNRVISVGFNGLPAGVHDTHERLNVREIKYEMIVHAEQNALLFAGPQAEGATIYVTPLPPCARCAVIIIQAGIKRVVCPKPDLDREPWATQAKLAGDMFSESGLEFLYVE